MLVPYLLRYEYDTTEEYNIRRCIITPFLCGVMFVRWGGKRTPAFAFERRRHITSAESFVQCHPFLSYSQSPNLLILIAPVSGSLFRGESSSILDARSRPRFQSRASSSPERCRTPVLRLRDLDMLPSVSSVSTSLSLSLSHFSLLGGFLLTAGLFGGWDMDDDSAARSIRGASEHAAESLEA